MRRRLYTFFSALSLLLCVAVCGLWLDSEFVTEKVEWARVPRPGRAGVPTAKSIYWNAVVHRGELGFARDRSMRESDAMPPGWYWLRHKHVPGSTVPLGPQPNMAVSRLGLIEWGSRSGRWFDQFGLKVQIWPIAAITAVLPVTWAVRSYQARQTRQAGRCPSCGYDLRATPDRCPECGREKVTA